MKGGRGGQLGWAEAFLAPGLGVNAKLEKIAGLVKWERFETLLARVRPGESGRPPYPALSMFKALLLQQWYGLSDPGLEEALADRLSFRRFCGFALDEPTPDHTTLCRFRNDVAAAGLAETLFAEMNRQLDCRGLVLKRGTLIDATVVRAAVNPSGSAAAPSDPDAAFVKRVGRAGSTFGFKAHIAVDAGSGLLRGARLTPANVNETVIADALVQGDEVAVYADQAYDTRARRSGLRARGIKDRIMHRPNKHHPELPRWQRRRNRLIARLRGRVETAFAVLKRHYRWDRVRYVGLARNQSHLYLLCIALNLRRALAMTA